VATGFVAGQILTADDLNAWLPVSAVKLAGTTKNAVGAVADDPDLTITLLPNARYFLVVNLGAIGPTGADIQIGYRRTGTVTQVSAREFDGPELATTTGVSTLVRHQKSGASTPDAPASYGTPAGNSGLIREAYWVDGGATGGTLTLQWAQAVSTVGDTVLTGYMVATRVA
jgi:hypothetical protein